MAESVTTTRIPDNGTYFEHPRAESSLPTRPAASASVAGRSLER